MTSNLNILIRKKMEDLTFIWMTLVLIYLPDEFSLTPVSFLMSILSLNFNFSPKFLYLLTKKIWNITFLNYWALIIKKPNNAVPTFCLFCLKRSWYQINGRYIFGWNQLKTSFVKVSEHWLLRNQISRYPLLVVCLKRSWYQINGRYILG